MVREVDKKADHGVCEGQLAVFSKKDTIVSLLSVYGGLSLGET
jgi:hypothetical protein